MGCHTLLVSSDIKTYRPDVFLAETAKHRCFWPVPNHRAFGAHVDLGLHDPFRCISSEIASPGCLQFPHAGSDVIMKEPLKSDFILPTI